MGSWRSVAPAGSTHPKATGRDFTGAPLYWPALAGALLRLLNLRRQTTMARKKLANTSADSALQGADQSLFDDFLPHLIARLAYQLNSDLIEKLRHEGINVTRWRILAVLAMGDGVTISKIINRAMMQQSALSRALMNMESEGYVRRGPRRDDARYVEVFLTNKGRALFDALNVVVRRRQSRLLKDLSRDEVAAAFALIRRLNCNMAD
jgi:MarR family transcriptional regulator, organic hydroperoxide resistance regulator